MGEEEGAIMRPLPLLIAGLIAARSPPRKLRFHS